MKKLGKIFTCFCVCLIWNTQVIKSQILVPPPTDKEKAEYIASVGKIGLSTSKFIYSISKNYSSPLTGNLQKDELNKIVDGYNRGLAQGRGTVGLLDTNFDVVIGAAGLMAGGPIGLVGAAGVKFVKDQGISMLTDKIVKDQTKLLASNIDKFKKSQGLDYESLRAKKPENILNDLNKIEVFRNMREKMSDDPKARQLFDASLVDALLATTKSELEAIKKNKADIKDIDKKVAANTRQISNYVNKTNSALDQLSGQLGKTQQAVDKANVAIEKLQKDVGGNTEQLQVISDIMYSKETASNRLIMLKGGYLKNVLPEDKRNTLIESMEAQANREKVVSEFSNVMGEFNKVGQIANNLKIKSKDLDTVLEVGNAASNVANSLIKGDYLGALVGITGLFAEPRPDPAVERHKQMMDFLDNNFNQVNEKLDNIYKGLGYIDEKLNNIDAKLDRLYEGQNQINENIISLHKAITEQFNALHERLDELSFKIDIIHDLSRELYLRNLGNCGNTRSRIIGEKLDTTDSTKIERVLNLETGLSRRIPPCYEYLDDLFYTAFDPDEIGVAPLAIGFSKNPENIHPEFNISPDAEKKYFENNNIVKFKEAYKKANNFFVTQTPKLKLSNPTSLASLTLPANNVKSLEVKLNVFSNFDSGKTCSKESILSDPLLNLLCYQSKALYPSQVRNEGFPLTPNDLIKTNSVADIRSQKLLKNALMHDSTILLSDWALFYAPLYDIYDLNKNEIPKDLQQLQEVISHIDKQPKGKRLIEGALRIITVSLAQMNMLYGDVTAKMIFDQLWDSDSKRFLPQEALQSQEQKAALEMFKSNPYLQRNVLMIGLDKTSNLNSAGEKVGYISATDSMKTLTYNKDFQLKASFGKNWNFENLVKDPIKIPSVNLYGTLIPLPKTEDYIERAFYYPTAMLQMLNMRDLLADRIANYDAIVWAAKDSPNPTETRARMVNILLKLSN